MEETRQVQSTWDLSTFRFRIEGEGIKRMLKEMKEAKLLGNRCHQCGTVYLPANFYCRKCHIAIHEPAEISDHGKVMSYTIGYADVRGNPLDEPRVSLMVKLDGSDTWIMGAGEDIKPEEVHIGMRVKIKWAEQRVGNLQDMESFIPE